MTTTTTTTVRVGSAALLSCMMTLHVVIIAATATSSFSSMSEPPSERRLQKMSSELLQELWIPYEDRNDYVLENVDTAFLFTDDEIVEGGGGGAAAAHVDPSLLDARGQQEVIVRLKSPPVASVAADGASPSDCMAHKAILEEEQSSFLHRCSGASSVVQQTGCLHTLLNAIFLLVDAQDIVMLASDPDVLSVHRVVDFEKSLDERVPAIGATEVQQTYGVDGSGVRVAVLDSGIDYTHADLGGNGTQEAWDAAYKDFTSRDGLFPTDKVVEGWDFVGETWPEGPREEDEDPIDIDGHGTHCADIIGGNSGVAPGVLLYAVKVCSAINSRCSGIALLLGMEFAVDPNRDGDPSDHVDVINLSLGGLYGQPFHDDLSFAVEAATSLGVLSVAAAGNSANKPYIVNTPASIRSCLAVAQTLIPPESPPLIVVDGESYLSIYQTWSAPLESAISGPIQYGDGNGGNLNGCAEFAPGSLMGKIVLVDRGECNFTLKIIHISNAGGVAGIIGLVDEGFPFDSADGGDGPVDIPAFMINQADSEAIKASLTEESIATIDPDNEVELPSRMARSSSRGPQNDPMNMIKPEIGGPGGSISAVASTGTERSPFGGTSASAPVVAGAASLLIEAYPELTPAEVKARLMNSGNANVEENEDFLAPITRVGSGNVRVDRSFTARAAAWDMDNEQGALSFGLVDVNETQQFRFKTVFVRNYSNETIIYSINSTFRYPEDEASGAVKVEANFPGDLQLLAGQDRYISVVMTIRGDLLPGNYMNSGRNGDNATALTINEYDGYLIFDDGVHPIHLPWHVLPRKAASVSLGQERLDFSEENPTTVDIYNSGAGTAQISTFSIIALSENIPEGGPGEQEPTPDIRAVGVTTLEVDPGVCSPTTSSFVWAFSISSWERQTHLINVQYEIFLDVDQDGSSDYVIINSDFDGEDERSDGRQVARVVDRGNGMSTAIFFAEHSMNTANTMLYICAEQVGLLPEDLLSTSVDITSIFARDFRYNGPGDAIGGLTITPGGERYDAVPSDVGPMENGTMPVTDRGAFDGNTPEFGLMVITNADRGVGARGGATQETEVKLLLA